MNSSTEDKNIKKNKRHHFYTKFRPNGWFDWTFSFHLISIFLLIGMLNCGGSKANGLANILRVLESDNVKGLSHQR